MKFFFDNNLSPYLAHGIRELSKITAGVEQVIHLTDRFERDAPDLTWIGDLTTDGPWYIISIDRFKKQHGAEREAIRRSGHTVFVLDGQWSKHGFWLQSERLVRWWPQMVNSSSLVSGGAYRVPWQHSPSTKLQAITF
ncbi:MAG: hypothetical protein M3R60_15340 [Pseudomonadota bacterium]|nr:hypothetical protein [Pseudomonadota bacterium]